MRIQTYHKWITFRDKKYYMKSSWEITYAYYLEFLLSKKKIKDWDYETETFWFNKIKRGVRSYKPDFRVTSKDDSIEYHEIKGYMDKRSATKLKRMRIYHPKVKLILIDGIAFKDIKAWEKLYRKDE